MKPNGVANIHVLDVYHYDNMPSDFAAFKNAGFDGLIIKACEGTTFTDPEYQNFYTKAKAAGLKVGFYSFFRVNEYNGLAQANYFITRINAIAGVQMDYLPCLDVEVPADGSGIHNGTTTAQQVQIALAAVKAAFGNVMLYADKGTLDTMTIKFSDYPLWIARYPTDTYETGAVTGDSSILPRDVTGYSNWIGWQYHGGIGGASAFGQRYDENWFTSSIYLSGQIVTPPSPTISWYVIQNGAKLKALPSPDATTGNDSRITSTAVIATLNIGDIVTLDRYVVDEAYARVIINGHTGWILETSIGASNTPAPSPEVNHYWHVVVSALAMRNCTSAWSGNDPAIGISPLMKMLHKGDKVSLERYVKGEKYARVSYKGSIGWIYLTYINY